MSDPLADFIRNDRQALVDAAPPLHAARLWHEARRRRADALRRNMNLAGWLVRLAVTAAVLVSFWAVRPDSYFLFFLWALMIWLTWGACAPIHRRSAKGISQ